MTDAISSSGLRRYFGRTRALDGLDLRLHRDQVSIIRNGRVVDSATLSDPRHRVHQ